MDFWKQCSVFAVLWKFNPKLWETCLISSICMINLPEHQRCTQLSLGGTFIWRKCVTIFWVCFKSMIHGYTAHIKECWKLKKRLEVSEICPESVTVFKILFTLPKVQWRQKMSFNKPWTKPIKQWLLKYANLLFIAQDHTLWSQTLNSHSFLCWLQS